MTSVFAGFMRKAGHVPDGEVCSEAAVSVLLSAKDDAPAWCTLDGLRILHRPDVATLEQAVRDVLDGTVPDAVMTGMSGSDENDSQYGFVAQVLPGVPVLRYKHLFGVNFSSSAIGFYAAACCLNKGVIPSVLAMDGRERECSNGILVVNAVEGRHYSISILRPICGKV